MNLLSAKEACYDGLNTVIAWANRLVNKSLAMNKLFTDS
jgi:hypothetical protein